MNSFTERDVEILDSIIKIALTKRAVFPEDLEPLSNSYLSRANEIKANDYSYYLDILKEYNVVKINSVIGNRFRIEPIHIKTQNFSDQGGFKAEYDNKHRELKRSEELDELSLKKLRWDSKISKWQAKTFWYIFGFACIGGLYSTYDIVTKIVNNNNENLVTKSQMKLELSRLHTLILDQKMIDSLRSSKNHIDSSKRK